MSSTITYTGNPRWLRYGGYLALFFGGLFAIVITGEAHREYLAQRWPISSGRVLSAELKSRSDTRSTIYWVKFTVLFDLSPEDCLPREPRIIEGGPTRCRAAFNSFEGSRENANQWIQRHPNGSRVQFHYEPHGPGVRFAGESMGHIYPWSRILVMFGVFAAGLAMVQFGRRWEANLQDPVLQQSSDPQQGSPSSCPPVEADETSALVDLNLRN